MSLLQTIEKRIARIIEGTFGRVFRSNVQPVELARRLVKEMDEHQQRTVRSVYVPNRYDVYLSREDHRQLSPYAAALTTELGEYLAEHARRNDYSLLTRPKVHLQLDRDLGRGSFGIAVQMEEASPLDDAAASANAAASVKAAAAPNVPVQPLDPDAGPELPSPAAAISAADELGADDTQAQPAISAKTLALKERGGKTFALDHSPIRVGRGRANGITLSDNSISREHAEFFRNASDEWMIRDLDSTNGIKVNGLPTQEQIVRVGDRITFGSAEYELIELNADGYR